MAVRCDWIREGGMAAKFAGVGLIGFATDFVILRIAMGLGLEPAWARVISLFCAMQVTFTINGLHVFHCLERKRFVSQWVRYMATNGFGNLCNYLIFVTMVSTHWRIISAPAVALCAGSSCAWGINYLGARFVAFAGSGKVASPKARVR